MMLKINWFPIQVPKSPITINGLKLAARGDFNAFPNVRQYQRHDGWLAAVVSEGDVPADFESIEVNCEDLPILTSALTLEAFLDAYKIKGFKVERGKGQGTVLTTRQVAGLPPSAAQYSRLRPRQYSTRSRK